jgi:hypothetical protein
VEFTDAPSIEPRLREQFLKHAIISDLDIAASDP